MKRIIVVLGFFMMLAATSFAQAAPKGHITFSYETPNVISTINFQPVSITRNMSWNLQYTLFKNWGFMFNYHNTAARFAGINGSYVYDMSNIATNTKTLGLTYQYNELYRKGSNKGYGIYSLTGFGYQLGARDDAARGGLEGQVNWRSLYLAQNFSFYLDRTKRRSEDKVFSSINFHGELGIPMSKSFSSNIPINENAYLPGLPSYFGVASLTPKFKLVGMGSNTVNLLATGTYTCRAYDFRPGANWYNVSLGLSMDSKRVFGEILSLKVTLFDGNMGDVNMTRGNFVFLSFNAMPLIYRSPRAKTVSPTPK